MASRCGIALLGMSWLLAAGCVSPPGSGPTQERLSVAYDDGQDTIRLFEDGTARCRLVRRVEAPDKGAEVFLRSFEVQAETARIIHLRRAILALAPIVPAMRQDELGRVEVIASNRCRTATVQLNERILRQNPLWRGLVQECRFAAHRDLCLGLMEADIAEFYASKGDDKSACERYLEAMRAVLDWRSRLREESGSWGLIIDLDVHMRPVEVLNAAGRFGGALERARKAWPVFTKTVDIQREGDRRLLRLRDRFRSREDLNGSAADQSLESPSPDTTE